jgi:hypothetical protein
MQWLYLIGSSSKAQVAKNVFEISDPPRSSRILQNPGTCEKLFSYPRNNNDPAKAFQFPSVLKCPPHPFANLAAKLIFSPFRTSAI